MKKSNVILTFIGMAGVIATAVLAVKETPKALKKIQEDSEKKHNGDPNAYTMKEAIRSAWKYYIPSFVVGAVTISSIAASTFLSKKQEASLIAGYSLLKHSYEKVKELEADHNTKEEKKEGGIGSEEMLFYDLYSDRYFWRTITEVIDAEYRLNRMLAIDGCATLNNFYNFLGLEETESGSYMGWSISDIADNWDYYWLDFIHSLKVDTDDPDAPSYYYIQMMADPIDLREDNGY